MPADLVLVHGDPLSDARALWRVWAVFQGGLRVAVVKVYVVDHQRIDAGIAEQLAGLLELAALDEHVEVVLVEPKDAFVHNIGALRALVERAHGDRRGDHQYRRGRDCGDGGLFVLAAAQRKNVMQTGNAAMNFQPMKAPQPGQAGIQPAPVHNGKAYWIKVSAQTNGSFTVTNTRNGFSKTYAAR